MAKEKKEECDVEKMKCDAKWHKKGKWHKGGNGMMGGCFYFLAIIGTAVYYVEQVSGFWPTILAILKACVWPAFLIYEVFVRLAM